MTQQTIAENDGRIITNQVGSSTGPFTVDFPFFNLSDVVVTLTDSDGTVTTLTRGADYTLTATAGDDGSYPSGSVTLITAVANTLVTRYRRTTIERLANFPLTGFLDRLSLNAHLNQQTTVDQDFRRLVSNTLRIPDNEDGTTASLLPAASARLGKILVFDATTGMPSVSTLNLSDIEEYVLNADFSSIAAVAIAVTDVAALKALVLRPEAVVVKTGAAAGLWQWVLGSTTTPDDILVAQPTSGAAGRYKKVLDTAYLPLTGGTLTGALVLSGDPTVALNPTTKQYVDAAIASSAVVTSASVLPVRQTIASGPVSSSTGLPTFLPATAAGLAVTAQNINSTTPLVAFAAGGFTTTGVRNRLASTTSNPSWTGLTASRAAATPNFLCVTLNVDGTLTPGYTILPPIYQWGGVPSTTNSQYTFNIGEMKGYLGNGSTAPEVFIVWVGEAATDGTGVISTVAYGYNGKYESAFTNTLPAAATSTTANHNIGIKPRIAKLVIECITTEHGYAVGDQITEGHMVIYSTVYITVPMFTTAKIIGFMTSSSSLVAVIRSTGVPAILTAANWKYGFVADRGW